LPVWQSRAAHGLSGPNNGQFHNRLAKIPSQIGHNKTQQDQGDKTPKYPSPRLMTAAVDRRFFGFLIHQATANSIFPISVEVFMVSAWAVGPLRQRSLLQQVMGLGFDNSILAFGHC
jgi:hypothetical protein